MLERGEHVDPSEFTETTRSSRSRGSTPTARCSSAATSSFQVLQGMCVGGIDRRQQRGLLRAPRPRCSTRGSSAELDAPGSTGARCATPSSCVRAAAAGSSSSPTTTSTRAREFIAVEGRAQKVGLGDAPIVEANIADCLGCGYCNIGCAYGKKLSMLDTILPEAQAKHRRRASGSSPSAWPRSCGRRNGSVEAIDCVLSDDNGEETKLRVKANTVVVSAGAIASSWLLQRSRPRRRARRREPRLQHGLAVHRGLRRADPLLRRAPDLPLPRAAAQGLRLRDLVQPGRLPGAQHARAGSRTTTTTCAATRT